MYVRPISTRLLRGMLIPAIRAMPRLPLPLLVTGVLTDDQHGAVAPDDLALLAHRLHRRSYLHGSFQGLFPSPRLWPPFRLPLPRRGLAPREHAKTALSATNDGSKALG